jgi:hypothetical protein
MWHLLAAKDVSRLMKTRKCRSSIAATPAQLRLPIHAASVTMRDVHLHLRQISTGCLRTP